MPRLSIMPDLVRDVSCIGPGILFGSSDNMRF
jgi:hypothetical protein